jgi:hypothetical protein
VPLSGILSRMKKVASFSTITEAHFAAGILDAEGIQCEVRDEATAMTGGLGAGFEFSPTVWVAEEDLPAARPILEKVQRAPGSAWSCPSCRSENEAQFDACWSCGSPRT